MNPHTGAKEQTPPASDAYREGWDRIFGQGKPNQEAPKEDESKPLTPGEKSLSFVVARVGASRD